MQLVLTLHWERDEVKFDPIVGHDDPEGEQRYTFTLSLTPALDTVGSQRYAPVSLSPLPGKDPVPIV